MLIMLLLLHYMNCWLGQPDHDARVPSVNEENEAHHSTEHFFRIF